MPRTPMSRISAKVIFCGRSMLYNSSIAKKHNPVAIAARLRKVTRRLLRKVFSRSIVICFRPHVGTVLAARR